MDVPSYLLGKNAGGGGGGDSEYLNTEVTQDTNNTRHIQLLKKSFDVYVADTVVSLQNAFQYSDQKILPKIHCNNNVKYMQNMFAGNSFITSIDISGMNANEIVNASSAFLNCTSLRFLDMRNISFTASASINGIIGGAASNGPPSNCEIIVKSDVEKQLLLAQRPDLTNIKTVAEL